MLVPGALMAQGSQWQLKITILPLSIQDLQFSKCAMIKE
jgi:hypothetical protein